MSKSRILIQLDTDPQASVFDAVVAIDAGAERLLQYANIKPEQVRDLVHGAMYTRGPADLKHTAIFVGGSNVAHGEQVFRNAVDTMFEPFKVSVMIDCNGSNSTAAAAVISAGTIEGAVESETLNVSGHGTFRLCCLHTLLCATTASICATTPGICGATGLLSSSTGLLSPAMLMETTVEPTVSHISKCSSV
jgi:hypothetical protein